MSRQFHGLLDGRCTRTLPGEGGEDEMALRISGGGRMGWKSLAGLVTSKKEGLRGSHPPAGEEGGGNPGTEGSGGGGRDKLMGGEGRGGGEREFGAGKLLQGLGRRGIG